MTTVICVAVWLVSLSDENKSGALCWLAFIAMLSSCSGGAA